MSEKIKFSRSLGSHLSGTLTTEPKKGHKGVSPQNMISCFYLLWSQRVKSNELWATCQSWYLKQRKYFSYVPDKWQENIIYRRPTKQSRVLHRVLYVTKQSVFFLILHDKWWGSWSHMIHCAHCVCLFWWHLTLQWLENSVFHITTIQRVYELKQENLSKWGCLYGKYC